MSDKPLLPTNWRKPFEYLVGRATKYREITPFPTLFLAALNHDDQEAQRRVLVAASVAHHEASRANTPPELRAVANAVVWLVNQLAVVLWSREEAKEKEAAENEAKERAEKKAAEEREKKPEEAKPEVPANAHV